MRLLYIEDSEDLGMIAVEIFKQQGFITTWIKDRALHPQDVSQFDMVVSDFHVPNGEFSMTKKLCAEQNVPLLLVSGGLDAEIAQHHDHWMTKPFDKNVLIEKINELSQRGI